MPRKEPSTPPCILLVSKHCKVCKLLMMFEAWRTFLQWADRIGCVSVEPEDLDHPLLSAAKEWGRYCGAYGYTFNPYYMDVVEIAKTPAVLTPMGCVTLELPPLPEEKLVSFLKSGESREVRAAVKYQIERAKSLIRISCRVYGGCNVGKKEARARARSRASSPRA